ncbi:hypothetical protein OK351_11560 [Glutamicibacter sp. MNS18]|uniref:hypothetical protein n=1 Tax=Glutamicibacter sp. MNS18 TaxID=2989817 RepID=UPI002235CD28|nr:hypothetical protein [Glutamicibacter sp. MNS18]MCW4466135.1 hypothetical protein [Glutamicibacter sp. MNS18]
MTIPLYPRGFAYSRTPLELPDMPGHFQRREAANAVFWFSPDLDFHIAERADATVVLFGHAHYVTTEESISSLADIARRISAAWRQASTSGVEEILYDLAGRYGLFILGRAQSYAYQDAHGMRSMYRSADARLVTSHERLLADLTGAVTDHHPLAKLPLGIRWTRSRYDGIRAVIPNHRLNLDTGDMERFFGQGTNQYRNLSVGQRVDMVHALWTEQLRVLARTKKIALSITGGLDSRVSLAMARPWWDEIRTFTYTTEPVSGNSRSKSLHKDQVIVERILEVVNLNHCLIPESDKIPLTAHQESILAKNSAGTHGRWLLNLYRERVSGPNVVHLRGNLNETARNYFHEFVDNQDPLEGIYAIMRDQIHRRATSARKDLPSILDETRQQYELLTLDELGEHYLATDFFYWEVRMSRWFSEVFNETDCAFDTVIPFNHRRIIDIALSFSEDQRREGLLFHELINKSAPFLNFFGVNDTRTLYDRYQRPDLIGGQATRASHRERALLVVDTNGAALARLPFTGTLYIPREHLLTGNEARIVFPLEEYFEAGNRADVRINISNSYSSAKAVDYLELIAEMDGQTIARQDLAYWPRPFGISLTDLAKDTQLTVRLRALRDIPKASWENASRTGIQLEVLETMRPGTRIRTDNPYLQVVNQ